MTQTIVRLYDRSNFEELPWPNTVEAKETRAFLTPLIQDGVGKYIDNIHTSLMALCVDNLVLPISINDAEYANSYVCSPYGQYVLYAAESISSLKKRWWTSSLQFLIKGLGVALRGGKINKVVIVNNWFFSTNLYPNLSEEQVSEIRRVLEERFPDHAIMFRSIHTYQEDTLFRSLKNQHFNLIASRQVFFLNTQKEEIFNSRLFKSDFKLLRESAYETISCDHLSEQDAPRITSLYRSVYLNRHSQLNPQLNEDFMRLVIRSKILKFRGLKKDGDLEAIVGHYTREGVFNCPLLGYDIDRSPQDKLYRLTSTILTLKAKEEKTIFHLSSGASFFKKIRKAEGNIEYHAVYHRHLPYYRRLPWTILKGVSNSIGIPFMRYYDK